MKININSPYSKSLFELFPNITLPYCTVFYRVAGNCVGLTSQQLQCFLITNLKLYHIDIKGRSLLELHLVLIIRAHKNTSRLNTFIPRYVSSYYELDPVFPIGKCKIKWLCIDSY